MSETQERADIRSGAPESAGDIDWLAWCKSEHDFFGDSREAAVVTGRRPRDHESGYRSVGHASRRRKRSST